MKLRVQYDLNPKLMERIRQELPQDLETARRFAQPGGHQPGAHGDYSETDDPLEFHFSLERMYGVPVTLTLQYNGSAGKLRRVFILDGKGEDPFFYAPINL